MEPPSNQTGALRVLYVIPVALAVAVIVVALLFITTRVRLYEVSVKSAQCEQKEMQISVYPELQQLVWVCELTIDNGASFSATRITYPYTENEELRVEERKNWLTGDTSYGIVE